MHLTYMQHHSIYLSSTNPSEFELMVQKVDDIVESITINYKRCARHGFRVLRNEKQQIELAIYGSPGTLDVHWLLKQRKRQQNSYLRLGFLR